MPRAPVIGVVGNDVPRQLVLAAGARPYRLTGTWTGGSDAAQELLGATDAAAAAILDELRSREHGLAGVVVSNDSDAHRRLFYALRAAGSPLPVHLLDLPRRDSECARRFARFQFTELVDFCARLTGRRPDGSALRAAARAERALGDALDRLRARRRALPSECAGTDAIEALLAAARLDPAEALGIVDAARGDATVDPRALRVHLTGSAHPDATVYRALESRGCVVVGEDHDTGDAAWIGVAADGAALDDVVDGLIDAHFARTTASPTVSSARRADLTASAVRADRAAAVAVIVRELDEAPAWDVADQRMRLDVLGIPLLIRTHVRPGDVERTTGELADELTATRVA